MTTSFAQIIPPRDLEVSNLLDIACEGHLGCTAQVTYVVEWNGRHEPRREACCREHLAALVDYAERFGCRFTPPTVQSPPTPTRELVAA